MNRWWLIVCIAWGTAQYSFGQEPTDYQMNKRIQDLERRVSELEKIILGTSLHRTDSTRPQFPIDKDSWRKLRVGMNDDEVRTLLGTPTNITRFSPEYYTWRFSEGGSVTFMGQGLSAWDEPD